MDTIEAIRNLKSRIKSLAIVQRKAKRARKTVKISAEERRQLIREITGSRDVSEWWSPATDVLERRALISACLDLYNELREKEFRHGAKKGLEYLYRRYSEELRKEFGLVKA